MTRSSMPQIARAAILCTLVALAGCATVLPQVDRPMAHALKADVHSPLVETEENARLAPGLSGFRPMAQGAIALDARIALIENATTSVDLQTYLLADDRTGRLVLRSLRDAARRGVRVRVLLDDYYTDGMDPMLLGLAAYPNVQVQLFNPFTTGRGSALGRVVEFAGSFRRLNHRMHNKLLLADGVMAVAGGRNTADEYFFRSPESNFVDFDLLITGELVNHLGELFDMYWNSQQVVPIAAVAHSADTPEERRRFFDHAVDGDSTPRAEVPAEVDLFGLPAVSLALAQRHIAFFVAPATAHADSPLKASLTQASSEEAADTVRRRAMALLPQTRSELIMFSPYFIPGDAGLAQFKELREKGVTIRVITNSLPTSDEPLVNVGYEHYRSPLLKMGAKIYELSSTRLGQAPSMHRALGQSKGQLHAKMGFVDREITLVGSMNMDPRSANINTELGISVRSPELTRKILAVYQIDHLVGVYEVKLKPDGEGVRWSSVGENGEEFTDEEPDSDLWQRLRLSIQHLFISDDLL